MTRAEALTKLLALGPLFRAELAEITRWPKAELEKLLFDMRVGQQISLMDCGGGRTLYLLALPAGASMTNAEALQARKRGEL